MELKKGTDNRRQIDPQQNQQKVGTKFNTGPVNIGV